MTIKNITFITVCSFFIACSSESSKERIYPEDSSSIQILEEVAITQSGLGFNNRITENEFVNAVSFDGLLQGAGVAVLDANNDGLMDIFFASNMEGDKLYINEGDFKFKDQTKEAGITKKNWSTGVAVVDINNDSYDDIYVCKFLFDEKAMRENVFYINNGDGTFTDRAREMGLADRGYGIMANFFDYDKDGDLDMYLANQPPNSLRGKDALKGKLSYSYTDRLFRNDGGKFTDVTNEAGIKNYTYSLSCTTLDVNQDGWTDMYVACDYDEPDFLYVNNGDGTFTDIAHSAMKHMSNFSMGVDIADINNDTHLDVLVVDMVAEDNFRQKTNMSGMNPERFYALADAGYHYQYMFNAMHLNNGDNTFSEIAQLSGISNTDWSWTPLFVDFDQDSYKDLIVTNGIIKEMRNKDFENWRKDFFAEKLKEAENSPNKNLFVNPMEISQRAPSFKIANFIYRNEGDLSFSKQNANWGFDKPTWSQGAAYADFDNDGDLDLVINNMNMEAGLYKNTANEKALNNYLSIRLKGDANNIDAIGSMIYLKAGDNTQAYEYTPYRGYMSTSQRIAHFGLGKDQIVDELTVVWPDGSSEIMSNLEANQILTIKKSASAKSYDFAQKDNALFTEIDIEGMEHAENDFDDFKREILLPYQLSTQGPKLAKADIDSDGDEDIFIGSSTGNVSKLFLNNGEGAFTLSDSDFSSDKKYEDGAAHFFDADGDGDLDLYVGSGGSEFEEGSSNYQDRLYMNTNGRFTKSSGLPSLRVSTGAVVSLDIDADGDLDLFVGGRQRPGYYGKPVDSYLLENNGATFKDVSANKATFLKDFGMVTDAHVDDIDGDGNNELIVAGEWMPITVCSIADNGLTNATDKFGLSNTKGWWNTIELSDIDMDGDKDILAGNLGYNIKYKASVDKPFKLYVDDFDQNGSNDVYLGYYEGNKCFPVRGRQCSSEQMPFVKKKFKNYNDFGLATIDDVLEGRIAETTVVQEAHTFANSVFINDGGSFTQYALPNEAQISPVYGIAVDDFNGDGKPEIFLAGNMYDREVETTRSDAGKGCMILMDANNNFTVKRNKYTGISTDKDVRDVMTVKAKDASVLLVANNDDPVQIFKY